MQGWVWTSVLNRSKRRWCSSAKKMQKEAFFQRKGRAEVEGNDSNDTLVLDDDAHKVNLHTRSYFFCIR